MRDFKKFCLKKQEQVIPVPDQETIGEHDYVEIGGIKWATMNLGASNVTDYGLYFQWGDTQGYTLDQIGQEETKKQFSYEDYIYYDNNNYIYTKYTGTDSGASGTGEEVDGLTTLQSSDDAVTAAWGNNWKTPTPEDFKTLLESTTGSWVENYENSGVAGYVLTANDDENKKLFFPAGGSAEYGNIDLGYGGQYWANSLESYGVHLCKSLNFSEYDIFRSSSSRILGLNIRGILSE